MANCNSVYIPIIGCDDCSSVVERLERIEEVLSELQELNIIGTDTNGNSVTITVLGKKS